ncbi:MAG: DUF721 domain-containing protein [Lentisphaerae bacterium]|nr:DUF721 domain-containing protein [Lentisphaerota bacterium]
MSPPSHRKRAFNRGRWEIQRERAQLEDPAPPAPDRAPRVLVDGIAAILKTLQPAEDAWLDELKASWAVLVGADMAKHTRPASVHQKVLTIYVDNSAWLSELQRFAQKRILENVQKRFGATRLSALRLRLDPDGPRPAPRTP